MLDYYPNESDYYTSEYILKSLEGEVIGGGEGYTANIDLTDADVVVNDRSGLLSAINDGVEVVGIEGTAQIDLSGQDINLDGQTLVSDRGVDGSPGALVYTTDHGEESPAWDGGSVRGLIAMRGDARISGIRLRGPYHDYYDNPRYPGYIPIEGDSASERRRNRQQRYARGITITSDDVEVDNCEIYGWPVQAIVTGSASSAASPHIHHIYGHDCMMDGYGYIIENYRGHVTVEMSYFDATRHAITGFGYPNCGFTIEDCVFGPSVSSSTVDMHALAENLSTDDLTAGGRVEVRRCTFTFTHGIDDRWTQAITFRGYPEEEYITENCRFVHEITGDPPVENVANDGYEPVPYRQINVPEGEYFDWTFRNNQYGLGEPKKSYIGAPVNLDAPMAGDPLIGAYRRQGYLQGIELLRDL